MQGTPEEVMKNLVLFESYVKNYFFGIEVAEVPKKTNPHVPDLPPYYVLDLPPHDSDPPPRVSGPPYVADLPPHVADLPTQMTRPKADQHRSANPFAGASYSSNSKAAAWFSIPSCPTAASAKHGQGSRLTMEEFPELYHEERRCPCSYFKWVKVLPQKVRIFIELQTSHFIF